MKKYESILKRVRFAEEKYGIRYAKPDGKLCGSLRTVYLLLFIYHSVMTLLFLAGILLLNAGTEHWGDYAPFFWAVCGAQAIAIGGLILQYTPLKLWGCAVSVIPTVGMILIFGHLLADNLGWLGIKVSFYWRHFAPLAVMILLLVWMIVLIVRATVKTDRQYKRIVENLYAQYHIGVTEDDTAVSEEQWETFLATYDPRKGKEPFSPQKDEE